MMMHHFNAVVLLLDVAQLYTESKEPYLKILV